MAWKEVGGNAEEEKQYPVWDEKEPIEGKYLKSRDKVGPHESKQYFLETDKGTVKVWGSTVLDGKFSEGADGKGVPIGSKVRIKRIDTPEGKNYKNYLFAYDDSDVGAPKLEDIA